MSVSMTKADGVTLFSMTSDQQSRCPPLCQIFKGLCYSPFCCSVSQQLRGIQGASQSVLGALHIMVGLLNMGLGAILCSHGFGSWNQMEWTLFPFWLGGIFIFFGVVCVLSEKFPSRCLVLLNVILSVAGVAFAIAAIVLYSINIRKIYIYWLCNGYYSSSYYNRPTPSTHEYVVTKKCNEGKELLQTLLRSINGVLIVLSVLELCVAISAGALGIKALRSSMTVDDSGHEKPLLEEVTGNAAV